MRRRTTVLVTVAAAVVATVASITFLSTTTSTGAPAPAVSAPAASGIADVPGSGQPVADWNRTLITILGTPGKQPATVHPTRSFAMLQAAEYTAVVSIT